MRVLRLVFLLVGCCCLSAHSIRDFDLSVPCRPLPAVRTITATLGQTIAVYAGFNVDGDHDVLPPYCGGKFFKPDDVDSARP